jgi:hypothetical protein
MSNVEASDSYPWSRLLLNNLLVIHPSTPYNDLPETERYQLMLTVAAGVPTKMKQSQNSHCGFVVLSVTTNIFTEMGRECKCSHNCHAARRSPSTTAYSTLS